MTDDDLSLPEFLNRKLHPELNSSPPRSLKARKQELIWPEAKDWNAVARERRQQHETVQLNGLTAGEQEELLEIKLMAKTDLNIAKSMAAEWVNRNSNRTIAARRRNALRTVKGLHRA